MNWKLIIALALIAYGGYQHFNSQSAHDNKTTTQVEPEKKASINQVSHNLDSFKLNDYTISPVAPFEIQARVLSSKHYTSDREADLSTVDLALGWGRMADDAVIKEINIIQKRRFYFWRVLQFPIPRQEIETSSANMHMVPASNAIAERLKAIKQGQTVSIKGSLINASAEDGWQWKSSTTRNDTGKGACELVYVEQVIVN